MTAARPDQRKSKPWHCETPDEVLERLGAAAIGWTRNPKTGIEVSIAERRVMVFKPSNVLKARINGMAVADEEDA